MYELIRFVIPRIAAEWEDIAFSLRYPVVAVQGISEKQRNDPLKCCRELFMDWLSTSHGIGPKTWSTLLQTIGQVPKLTHATEEIKKNLIIIYGTCVCS